MNVVCFGQQNWHVTWTAKQQLLTRLARRGHRVLYVDPIPTDPKTLSRRDRVAALRPARTGFGLTQVMDGLHVYTPVHPAILPKRLRGRWQAKTIRQVCNQLGVWAPVTVCCWPAQRWLMEHTDPRATVYLAFDDNSRFGGLSHDFAGHQMQQELELLREVDLVLAVSPLLVERFLQEHKHVHLQENGVELDDFSPAARRAAIAHPAFASLPEDRRATVGFVGQIDDRFDTALLTAVADKLPNVQFVLFGRAKDKAVAAALADSPNITLAGFVDYRELPGVYANLDVGIVPYVMSPLTRACNPLKVYEYLAADVPTVSTPLPGLNSTTSAIDLAENAVEFAAAIESAIADPGRLRQQRKSVAEQASWQRRVDQFEDRLHEATELASHAGRHTLNRPDRHGRLARRIEPRLDGKDRSVRTLLGNYDHDRLSLQQRASYVASRLVGLGLYGGRRAWRLLRGLSGDRAKVRRILVVRNGHLGDTVVFFPTLAALRRKYPHASIAVAVAPGSGASALLRASPDVDDVVELDFFNRARTGRLLGIARLLMRGYDLVVGGVWYFHRPEAVFSGAPLRLGLYDGHPLQRYADRVIMLDPALHEAENNLRLAELVTGPVPLPLRVPEMRLSDGEVKRRGEAFRDAIGLGEDIPCVALHPGSKRPSRRWPTERFAELTRMMLEAHSDLRAVFSGVGQDECDLIEDIIARLPEPVRDRAISACNKGDLIGLIGFYDSCKCLICNDTGVMHVARARGVPLVAVIGPENDRRWGPHPWGKAPAVVVRQQVPGTPHGKWDCRWNLSLGSVEAERVFRHVDGILTGTSGEDHIVTIGRERFHAVQRDVERLSFAGLAERGLSVPSVTAVLAQTPSALASAAKPSTDDALSRCVHRLLQQGYPNLKIVIAATDPEALVQTRQTEAIVVPVEPGQPDDAWARLLAAAPADLWMPWHPGLAMDYNSIGSRVSMHIRGPETEATDGGAAYFAVDVVGQMSHLLDRGLLVTDALLRLALAHPMPPIAAPKVEPARDSTQATAEPIQLPPAPLAAAG